MKKVRVYELAKEFGMESKVLTAKLMDFGYSVKAYNSTLDDETAAAIRKQLSGSGLAKVSTSAKAKDIEKVEVLTSTSITTVDSEEVEDKRISAKGRGTIIRRRRTKIIEETPEPSSTVEEIEETVKEVVPPVTPNERFDKNQETNEEKVEMPLAETEAEKVPVLESDIVVEGVSEPEPLVPTTKEELSDTTAKEAAPQEDGQSEEPVGDEGKEAESIDPVDEASLEEKAAPAPKDDPSRKGFARIIKKSAIKLPVEVERPRPAPKKYPKTQGTRPAVAPRANTKGPASFAKPAGSAPRGPGSSGGPGGERGALAKGKKGKRFVKFSHDSGGGGKKGFNKKGAGRVNMQDVAMSGGRFSASFRGGKGSKVGRKGAETLSPAAETKAIKKRIKVYDTVSIGDLAHRMGIKTNELMAKLIGLGVMVTVNQSLDVDTASIVASEFGFEVEQAMTEEFTISNLEDQESGGEMEYRPPVVTVMGHVDHGKTSILDAIRKSDVAEGEAGGITQHIGAHYVRSSQGDVVFLDTPGHAAFTQMRSRGAKVTDIVVLVVAADDGVMEQTKEAINHAKAAGVPIVVAVNKIDKENADPMRVKRELAEYELTPEEWGGSTIFCETSAKKNKGIDELLEQILLQAEILELKADRNRKARGRVVEAKLHKGRGPVATILVQQGTLRLGDTFVAGDFYGRVKSLLDDKGKRVDECFPSWPVEVQGLNGVPSAGDEFVVVADEKMARTVAGERLIKSREKQLSMNSKVSLDNLFDKLKEGDVKELKVLLRTDVQGTLEAFVKALENLGTDAIKVKVIHSGTGGIIDSDVLLAAASDAIIIGFNVRPSLKVQSFAAKENVDIRYYDVIYHALEDVEKAMTGMLDSVFVERVIGNAEVRDIFSAPKIGTIAGCYVTDGKIVRGAQARLIRNDVVVFTGTISSLRRFKDDAKEVSSGYECGVGLENYNDIKEDDVIEAFVFDEVAGKL